MGLLRQPARASGPQAIAHRHEQGVRRERLDEPPHHRRIQPAGQALVADQDEGEVGRLGPPALPESVPLTDLEVENDDVEVLEAQALPDRLSLRFAWVNACYAS